MNGRLYTLTETRDDHPDRLTVRLEGHELARFDKPTPTEDGWAIAVPDGRMYLVVPIGDCDDLGGVS